MMKFGPESVALQDGALVSLPSPGITVVVGPNGSGKSALLRDIVRVCQGSDPEHFKIGPLRVEGSAAELRDWFEARSFPSRQPDGSVKHVMSFPMVGQLDFESFLSYFQSASVPSDIRAVIAEKFVAHLDVETRLQATSPGPAREVGGPPSHPIHAVWDDALFEARLSRAMKMAFGIPVCINRLSSSPQLLLGEPWGEVSLPPPARDRGELFARTALGRNSVGDGTRSFAGTLLNVGSGMVGLLLIDEPEAFLHPPQARMIGQQIAKMTPIDSQVVVATHSAEVVEGILDAQADKEVCILRMGIGPGSERTLQALSSDAVKRLWSDAAIRSSRLVDGLFATATVVCEGDSDARFYSAAYDAFLGERDRSPDVHWMHLGGNSRILSTLALLRSLGLRAGAIVDFDFMFDRRDVSGLFSKADGSLERVMDLIFRLADDAVGGASSLTAGALKSVVREIISRPNGSAVTDEEKESIRRAVREDSGRRSLKRSGYRALTGDGITRSRELMEQLAEVGLFVVPCGELESWEPTAGVKREWVAKALDAGFHRSRNSELDDFLLALDRWLSGPSLSGRLSSNLAVGKQHDE